MPVTVKIKRGTESQISSGSLSLGEVALATDTKSIFIGDGVGKTLVGKCIIDTFTNRPAYGKNGRFFYASDTEVLYLDNGSAWVTAGGAHTHTSAAISDATATPGASKVPISNGSGKLDGWISDSASGTKGLIQLTGHLGGTAASPTVTDISNDIVTVDKLAHGTQGEIIYYGASGVPAKLSAGTSGQYLKTQGAGANPVWADISAGGALTGSIVAYAGASVPSGYLECNGSNVSRTTYSALFTAIGTTWGNGDGSTTFSLPDLRRRVVVGAGGTGTATLGNAVGNLGGAETHTLSVSEMPSHNHGGTTGSHNHGGATGSHNHGGVTGNTATYKEAYEYGGDSSSWGGSTQNHNHSISGGTASIISDSPSIASQGDGGAHNNIQPSAVVKMIIKT